MLLSMPAQLSMTHELLFVHSNSMDSVRARHHETKGPTLRRPAEVTALVCLMREAKI